MDLTLPALPRELPVVAMDLRVFSEEDSEAGLVAALFFRATVARPSRTSFSACVALVSSPFQ
jgi:hypothetical protein